MPTVEIRESFASGTVSRTYTVTTTTTTNNDTTASSTQATASKVKATTRLDHVPPTGSLKTNDQRSAATAATQSFLNTRIAPLFLPLGYPHTVTPDYTAYQIYDSLQAFTSTIAGLLSSRAVLQSLGMDSAGTFATSTATYATLLSIARSTISNLSTILFADHMSSRISGEVKFYRFLADILNDTGFLLEMVSPSLPDYLKVPSLCLSSALRAMCGVAGGSSKAILSAHFALDGNIGELNAKDGSQETLVNLVGMWVGGVVVSRVQGLQATWCWMVALLSLHLWFNWLAVTSVRLRGLNVTRAGMVFQSLIQDNRSVSIEEVGKRESVFGRSGAVQGQRGELVLSGRIGASLDELVRCLGGRRQAGSGSQMMENGVLHELLHVFAQEQYLMWYTPMTRKAIVLLKEGASRDDQLKGWCHAVRVSHRLIGQDENNEAQTLRVITETLSINNSVWQVVRRQIDETGWDVSATVLESPPGSRLRLSASR